MSELEEMLRGDRSCGVVRGRGARSRAGVDRLAAQHDWLVREVQLKDVSTKQGFIEAWARALDFPAWHGKNWDAFEELVGDLSWLPGTRGVIVVVHGLAPAAEGEVEMGMDIVEASVENPARERPLVVVVA